MEIEIDPALQNLFELYEFVSGHADQCSFKTFDGFHYVGGRNLVWPNVFFNFSGTVIAEDTLTRIIELIDLGSYQPLLLIEKEKIDLSLLKKNGFRPIDMWVGMYHELVDDEFRNTTFRDNVTIEQISDKESLGDFLGIVSDELFGGKKLDADIFKKLIDAQHLIYDLSINNQSAGSALIYFDSHGNAGIYMFCILKSYQKMGYGKYFLIEIISRLNLKKGKKIVLQATKPGLELYIKNGFKRINDYVLFWKLK